MWRSTSGTMSTSACSITIGTAAPSTPTGGFHDVAAVGVTIVDAAGSAAAGAAVRPLREPSLASLAACCSVICGAAAGGWAAIDAGATAAPTAAAAPGLRLTSLASLAACCSVNCVAAAWATGAEATWAGRTGSATAGIAVVGGGGSGKAIGVDATATGGSGGGGTATALGVEALGWRLLSLASRARCSSVSSVVIAVPSAVPELRVVATDRDGWARRRRGRCRCPRRLGLLVRLRWVSWLRCLRRWRRCRCRSMHWRGGRSSNQWRSSRGLRRSHWSCVGHGSDGWCRYGL